MQGCNWSEVLCPSGAILPIMDGKGLFYPLRHILLGRRGPSQMQVPPGPGTLWAHAPHQDPSPEAPQTSIAVLDPPARHLPRLDSSRQTSWLPATLITCTLFSISLDSGNSLLYPSFHLSNPYMRGFALSASHSPQSHVRATYDPASPGLQFSSKITSDSRTSEKDRDQPLEGQSTA